MREMLAELLPDKASTLRMQNCANGVRLTFQRLTKESDVAWVKQNVNQATNAYAEGHCVTFGTKSATEQRDAVQRLTGLKDGYSKQAVQVAAIITEVDTDGLHIEPQIPSLNIRGDQEDTIMMDTTPTATVDPSTETRLAKVEGDVSKIQGDLHVMNQKIATMPGDIVKALREDRESERRREADESPALTQPVPTGTMVLMKRAKDLGAPLDPPAVGGSAWVVRKEDTGARVPLHVFVAAVPGTASPNYTVLAYRADGSLNTTAPCPCSLENFMQEADARNLAIVI